MAIGFSLAQYLPGPPTATPGARSLQESLQQVARNRLEEQRRRSIEQQQREQIEAQRQAAIARSAFEAEQDRVARDAAFEKEKRERADRARAEIAKARMGADPMAIDVLRPQARAAGIGIDEPNVPQAPVDSGGGLRMNPVTGEIERFGPEPDLDATMEAEDMRAQVADAQDARDAGVRIVSDPAAGETATYDPRQVRESQGARGQELSTGVAALPEAEGATPKYEKIRKQVESSRTNYYASQGLPAPEAMKRAVDDAQNAVQVEAMLDAAKQRGQMFVVGEGRRLREEERGELSEFEKSYDVNKNRRAVRGLDMATSSIAKNNGVLTGAARTMMATMYQSGVLSNQDFTHTVVGKAGLIARVASWFTGQLEGDLSEAEKKVLAKATVELAAIKRSELADAAEAFEELKASADPEQQDVYERRGKYWFKGIAPPAGANPRLDEIMKKAGQ